MFGRGAEVVTDLMLLYFKDQKLWENVVILSNPCSATWAAFFFPNIVGVLVMLLW